MTPPLCQVRVLTPEDARFEHRRALPDQADPDHLRASCRRPRGLPSSGVGEGDVPLIDPAPDPDRACLPA